MRGYYDAASRRHRRPGLWHRGVGHPPVDAAEFSIRDAFVLTNGAGANRFPIRAGTDAPMCAAAQRRRGHARLLEEAFRIMSGARAQIRQPLDSRAQVTISVVDTNGEVLGMVRAPDAPIFGIDVSLQKARTAAFFSGAQAAAAELGANPDPDVACSSRRCARSSAIQRPYRAVRLHRPRAAAIFRGPISPTARSAGRRGPSRARSTSSILSRPACSRRS